MQNLEKCPECLQRFHVELQLFYLKPKYPSKRLFVESTILKYETIWTKNFHQDFRMLQYMLLNVYK
jgi:hypothetical protein